MKGEGGTKLTGQGKGGKLSVDWLDKKYHWKLPKGRVELENVGEREMHKSTERVPSNHTCSTCQFQSQKVLAHLGCKFDRTLIEGFASDLQGKTLCSTVAQRRLPAPFAD